MKYSKTDLWNFAVDATPLLTLVFSIIVTITTCSLDNKVETMESKIKSYNLIASRTECADSVKKIKKGGLNFLNTYLNQSFKCARNPNDKVACTGHFKSHSLWNNENKEDLSRLKHKELCDKSVNDVVETIVNEMNHTATLLGTENIDNRIDKFIKLETAYWQLSNISLEQACCTLAE